MRDWLEGAWMVTSEEPDIGVPWEGSNLPTLILGFGFEREDDRANCNERHPEQEGVICRLWKNHEGPHVPFSSDLVRLNSVYVLELRT